MIITKTPFRMSFFGGGTDMESYFKEHGGAVLATTFDKYCYVTVRNLPQVFEYTTEAVYSKMERVKLIEEIKHPAIRNAMQMMDVKNVRLTYDADLPARSGLGTSSSFAVGMLHAFHALKGQYIDKKELADEAIRLERVLCNEAGGWQDQISAAYGGLNKIVFNQDGYTVNPVIMSRERKNTLNKNLLLFFTGFTRFSAEIQLENQNVARNKIAELQEMCTLVDEAERILVDANCSIDEFGKLLHHTWQLKKKTGSKVSNEYIDSLYEKGIKAGALGGKLLGAGGGGFLLFYVPQDSQDIVKAAMSDLLYVPVSFESEGSRVLHYTAEY